MDEAISEEGFRPFAWSQDAFIFVDDQGQANENYLAIESIYHQSKPSASLSDQPIDSALHSMIQAINGPLGDFET